jgi:hypothetical protein
MGNNSSQTARVQNIMNDHNRGINISSNYNGIEYDYVFYFQKKNEYVYIKKENIDSFLKYCRIINNNYHTMSNDAIVRNYNMLDRYSTRSKNCNWSHYKTVHILENFLGNEIGKLDKNKRVSELCKTRKVFVI